MGVCDGIIDESITMGNEMVKTLKREENRNTVKNDVEHFIQQKAILLQILVDAKLM